MDLEHGELPKRCLIILKLNNCCAILGNNKHLVLVVPNFLTYEEFYYGSIISFNQK